MAGVTAGQTRPRGVRLWLRAFVGFYPPHDESARTLDPVAKFLFSARSVILVISAQAAIIAGLLAAADRRFGPIAFILVVFGFVTAHAISNLSNDYFGYLRGHDTADSPRMRYTMHPIASGVLDARTLATGLGILAAIGAGIMVYFWIVRGPLAVAFSLAGLALLYLYDAAPKPLKSLGLGELAAFLVWGPLMIGGGYFVITGNLATNAFLVSIPYGLGVMSVLVGERRARILNRTVIVAMYVIIAILIALGRVTVFAAVAALALPRAWRAVVVLSRPRPEAPPAGYVGWPLWYHRVCLVHNRLFGWVYIFGLALGAAVESIARVAARLP